MSTFDEKFLILCGWKHVSMGALPVSCAICLEKDTDDYLGPSQKIFLNKAIYPSGLCVGHALKQQKQKDKREKQK